jgi:hypothetical protein
MYKWASNSSSIIVLLHKSHLKTYYYHSKLKESLPKTSVGRSVSLCSKAPLLVLLKYKQKCSIPDSLALLVSNEIVCSQ